MNLRSKEKVWKKFLKETIIVREIFIKSNTIQYARNYVWLDSFSKSAILQFKLQS